MHKVVIPFFLLVHVVPFFFFFGDAGWLNFLTIFVVQASFLLGLFVVTALAAGGNALSIPVNVPAYRSARILYLIFTAYFLLRLPFIVNITMALLHGHYLEYALSLAVQRYTRPDIPITPFYNVGTVLFLTFAFLLGAFAPYAERHQVRTMALLFLFMIFVESSALARAGVVIAMVACAVEALIRSNSYFWKQSILKIMIYFAMGAIVALALIVVVGYARVAGDANALREVFFEKLPSYTLAAYGAFLAWLQSVRYFDYAVGYNTFTFAFKLMGFSVPQGMYGNVVTAVGPTNLFLIYRGLLADFGVVGASALMFYFGLTVMRSSLSTPSLLTYLVLRCALLLIFFPILSMFSFTTVAAAFLCSHLLLALDRLQLPGLQKSRATAVTARALRLELLPRVTRPTSGARSGEGGF